MRLHVWSAFIATCAILNFGIVVAPDRVEAQISCPAASGDDGDPSQVTWVRATAGSCQRGLTSQSAYASPSTTSSSYTFMLFLPGDAPAAGNGNSAKFLARNASGAVLNINRITCSIYTRSVAVQALRSGVGSTVGTVELEDGDICDLQILFEDGTDEISYVGRSLSRVGDTYSISDGRLVGGHFGIEMPVLSGMGGATVERNGKIFAVLGDSPGLEIRSNTDDIGLQTVGQPFTLTYTFTSIGDMPLDIGPATFLGPRNLENCSVSYPDPRYSGYSMLLKLWVGHSVDIEFTCTPLQATDFDLELELPISDRVFRLTVNGAGTNEPDDPTQERTERIIKNFLNRRGDQIIAKEPDLTKRLGRRAPPRRSLKDAPPLKLGSPINITGEGTAHNHRLAFSSSLRQVAGSMLAAKQRRIGDTRAARKALSARAAPNSSNKSGDADPSDMSSAAGEAPDTSSAMGLGYGGYGQRQTGFGFWTEGTLSKVRDGTAKSDFDLLYVGADYRFNPNFVVGILGQFDRTDEVDATNDFSISGKGWLAGPYVVARLSANLIFDARAAWGKSENEVSPYNTYTDEFKGRRSLVRSRLTGDFQFGRLHVAPHVGVVYYQEEQKAYIDSLGNTISSQKVELGRLTFGPKLSTTFMRPDGASISPHIALHGIWDFRRTDLVNIDTGVALTGTDDFRARAQAGVTARRADGMEITAEGFYDGIGANGFNAYGGTLRFDVPF